MTEVKDSDGLVERLRFTAENGIFEAVKVNLLGSRAEAADHIEALEARIAALTAEAQEARPAQGDKQ